VRAHARIVPELDGGRRAGLCSSALPRAAAARGGGAYAENGMSELVLVVTIRIKPENVAQFPASTERVHEPRGCAR